LLDEIQQKTNQQLNYRLAIMRAFIFLVLLATTLSGCTLCYDGRIKVGDNQKAVAVSKVLEVEYVRQGLVADNDLAAPEGVYYWSLWEKPSKYNIKLTASDWVKDGTLFIRIAPPPSCNSMSRDFGKHMQSFMTNSFPDLEWRLTGTFILDVR
jgi:hypothetical protein